MVQGRFEEALAAYEAAVEEDPDFGRAYAGMGVVYGNLRQEAKAEASFQKALQHLDRMSERERYRTLGGYFLLVSHNADKAIENYQQLVERYPADGGAHSNLAYAYHMARQFERAVEAGRAAVELDPGNLIKRINFAIYAIYAGDFSTSMKESELVYEQNPDFGYALFTLGRAAAAKGDLAVAHDALGRLGESGGMGSSLVPIALADMEMVAGRYPEAVGILESAVETNDNPFQTATMLVALAEAKIAMEQVDEAVATAGRAIELSRHESIHYLAARALMEGGEAESAESIAVELENRLQSQATTLSALIRGELALKKGQLGTAMREFRWAREEHDIWFVHYLAGLAHMGAGQYPEAFDEFAACVGRKGEVTDVFLVDSATLRYFPPALYWLGRAHEALGNPEAARARYREYIDLRADADPPDPLVADASQRIP
jgi:tetratricopeptide (TPR) repeat protein